MTSDTIAVLIHGLNLRPEKMKEIESIFNAQGIDSEIITLIGHESNRKILGPVKAEQWVDQIQNRLAELRKDYKKIIGVGFSLGGLIWYHSLTQAYCPDAIVGLAPAISPTSWLNLSGHGRIIPDGFVLPSVAPLNYRCHHFTTVSIFRALKQLTQQLTFSKVSIPTVNFLSPSDLLVPLRPTTQLLDSWGQRVKIIIPNGEYPGHLIIDRACLGDEFEKLQGQIDEFLNYIAY